MFELNRAIAQWRTSCAEHQTITDSDLQELEGHLREEIDHLVLAGLSEEEAFLIATRRLGDTNTLATEFEKVNTGEIWKRRFFWMLAGLLLSMLAASMAHVISNGSGLLLIGMKINPYVTGVIGSVLYILSFLLLFFFLFLGVRRISARLYWRDKPVLLLLICAVMIILLKFASIVRNMIMIRIWTPEMFGQQAIASGITNAVWSALWPFVLVVLLLALWPSKTRTV